MPHRSLFGRAVLTAVAVLAVAAPVGLGSLPSASAAKVYDGPDVASYQHPNPTHRYPHGQPINWNKVANAGKEFAIVKATEGLSYTNPYFDGPYFHDYQDAAEAGLVRGAYHFARPGFPIVTSAVDQAKKFADVIGPVVTEDTLPPALDLEVTGGLTPPQLVTWAQVFLLEMRHLTGRTPMLYTYPSFWTTNLANPKALARYPLWMASYGVSRAPIADIWQYTSGAHVKGIVGNVDMSKYVGTTSKALPWATLSDGTVETPWVPAPPAAPMLAAATVDGTTATVTWRPSDAGTRRVTSYVVAASPGNRTETANGAEFAASFANLATTSSYTFTVTAVNAVGKSPASKPTNPITPTVPTTLSAAVAPSLAFGTKLPLSAKLTRADTKAALAGKRVLIFRRHTPAQKWRRVTTLNTDAKGRVSTVLHPKRSAELRAVFPGATGVDRSSVVRHYTVRPNVAAALSVPTVEHGHTLTLTGSVAPFEPGQIVTRQRRIDQAWVTKGTTKVTKSGTFSFTLVPRFAGDYVYRLVAAATDRHGSGHSPRLHLTVT